VEKLDLKKQYKHLYSPSAKRVELVDVPSFRFLMVDGAIEPGSAPGTSPGFQESVQALYSAAYTLKFMSKKNDVRPLDYTVMPLEGLWWVEGGDFDFRRKDNWHYTLMIHQPDAVYQGMLEEALKQLEKKKGSLPIYSRLRLHDFQEGQCVQTLHLGPYATEPATVENMHHFADENGWSMTGLHHEIYLGNPLQAQPEKLKTILRHPVKPANPQ
jgi:hypothetical protein